MHHLGPIVYLALLRREYRLSIEIRRQSSAKPAPSLFRIELSYGGPGNWELMYAETLLAATELEADQKVSEVWNKYAAFSGRPNRYKLRAGQWDWNKNAFVS